MERRGSTGVWERFIPGLGHGCFYKFAVQQADGKWEFRTDPFARSLQNDGNRTPMHLTAAGIQGTVSAGTLNVKAYRNTLIDNSVGVDVSTSTSGILNFDITDNGGSGGVANNGTSNGKVTGSQLIGISVFTNANATVTANAAVVPYLLRASGYGSPARRSTIPPCRSATGLPRD